MESAAAEAKRQLEAVQEGIFSRAATLSAAVGAIDQRIAELDSQFRAAEAVIEQEVEALVAQLQERAAVLRGELRTVYKGKKAALWQQREGLDSLRASLQSGLRRAAVLLGQPSPSPSRPSIPGTTALPPMPPAALPSSTGLRVELIRISAELAAQHLSAQIPSPAMAAPLQPRESAEMAVLVKDLHLEMITAAIPKYGMRRRGTVCALCTAMLV